MKRFAFFIVLIALISCSKDKRSDKAAEKMQDFVINISNYAREIDPDFIIIPQNGVELGFNQIDPAEGFRTDYLNAINGFGVEELFYNGDYTPDEERISMLNQLVTEKKVMVSEFINSDASRAQAYTENYSRGFMAFVRRSDNYHYLYIPDTIPNENANDVSTLAQAQNYLYLISSENYSSKQAMISAIAQTNFDVVMVDLFFDEVEMTSAEVDQLRTKANGGKRLVIAYMNIGSAEKFRYYWKKGWGLHHPLWLKRKYDGYSDEFWVKFWKKDWQEIIFGNDESYTKKILNAGFDGAYLDNVEAYYFVYHKD